MAKFARYKTFIAAFEMQSVSAAAQLLNVSTSAVSKNISALEGDLGVQLFERSNRNIKATESATQFYPECKSIVENIISLEKSLKEKTGEVKGELKITLSKSLLKSQMFNLLTNFMQQYPALRLHLDVSEYFQDLQATEFDFALRIGKLGNHSRLIAYPLQKVSPILCATPDYLEKYGQPITYDELQDHRFCHLPLTQLSQPVRHFFKQKNIDFSHQNHHGANDIEVIYQMVMANLGIGMMLDCSVTKELQQGRLIKILHKDQLPTKTLNLVFKKNEHLVSKNKLFKEFIKTAYQQMR